YALLSRERSGRCLRRATSRRVRPPAARRPFFLPAATGRWPPPGPYRGAGPGVRERCGALRRFWPGSEGILEFPVQGCPNLPLRFRYQRQGDLRSPPTLLRRAADGCSRFSLPGAGVPFSPGRGVNKERMSLLHRLGQAVRPAAMAMGLLFFLFIWVKPAAAQAAGPVGGEPVGSLYHHPTYGFSIWLPAHWQLDESLAPVVTRAYGPNRQMEAELFFVPREPGFSEGGYLVYGNRSILEGRS